MSGVHIAGLWMNPPAIWHRWIVIAGATTTALKMAFNALFRAFHVDRSVTGKKVMFEKLSRALQPLPMVSMA